MYLSIDKAIFSLKKDLLDKFDQENYLVSLKSKNNYEIPTGLFTKDCKEFFQIIGSRKYSEETSLIVLKARILSIILNLYKIQEKNNESSEVEQQQGKREKLSDIPKKQVQKADMKGSRGKQECQMWDTREFLPTVNWFPP